MSAAHRDFNKKPQTAAICANLAAKYLENRQKFDFVVNAALVSLVSIALLKMLVSY